MKKLLIFCLAVGFVFAISGMAQAATINVPGDELTIQDAIDAAGVGDTIIVAPGTYNERVVIDKPLTLQGEDRDTTIIDGTGMTAEGIPPYGNNGILISLGSAYHMQPVNVTIRGFTVQNFMVIGAGGGAGIAADPTFQYSNITISDVIAKDNGLMGIYVANIVNSQFFNIVVDNNDQIGNGQGYGIHSSVFSGGNTFSSITAVNHDSSGIMVMQSNNNTFADIASYNNGTGIYFLLGSSRNTITGSTICDNTNRGIELAYPYPACAENEIHFSNIVGNGYGINAADAGATFDATCNWWGDVSGPSDYGSGWGDAVSDNVDFEPWLLSEAPDGSCYDGFFSEIIDLCAADVKNHGQFVSCVAQKTKDLKKQEVITAKERAAIISWAAKSDIGKK